MNDNYIIILCIILLVITWGIYFKLFIKEGNDPNADNYTMPISFSGNNSDNIKIPQMVESNNGKDLCFKF
jgi:hypothetical protein